MLENGQVKMIELLVGALLAIIGGIAGQLFQARLVRRIRMDERIAERKIEANAAAYRHMKEIASSLTQKTDEEVLEYMTIHEGWLFDNRLFLPGKFADKWLAIRNGLYQCRIERSNGRPDRLTSMQSRIGEIAEEALDEIYADMKMKKLSPESVRNVVPE